MTRKQVKKWATKIAQAEVNRLNPNASKEDKARWENEIMQITNMVSCLRDGLDAMSMIDVEVQRQLSNYDNVTNMLKGND